MEGNELIILNNLEAFSEKLLDLIVDESKTGGARLITLIETALAEYKGPTESWFAGLVYSQTRLRGPEVNGTLKKLNAHPDGVQRLIEFKDLVQHGEWHEGSFNFTLYKHLIGAIPKHKSLSSKELSIAISHLRELLPTLIDESIAEQQKQSVKDTDVQMTLKFKEQRDAELKKLATSKNPNKDTVEFVTSIDQSKNAKGKTTFSLHKEIKLVLNKEKLALHNEKKLALRNEKMLALTSGNTPALQDKEEIDIHDKKEFWIVDWTDFSGAQHRLQPTDELLSFLTLNKIEQLDKLSSFSRSKVLSEAVKSRDFVLDNVRAFINPKELIDQKLTGFGRDLSASFVLLADKNQYSLIWINSWGQQEPIKLSEYPELQSWLKSQKTMSESQINELKTLLLKVKPHKPLEKDDIKEKLLKCLAPVTKAEPKEWLNNVPPVEDIKLKKPTKLGLLDHGLFKNVEDCIKQSHVREKIVDGEVVITKPQKIPGKLNVEHFAVAQLLGHVAKDEPQEASSSFLDI